jgi:hypothetical protein
MGSLAAFAIHAIYIHTKFTQLHKNEIYQQLMFLCSSRLFDKSLGGLLEMKEQRNLDGDLKTTDLPQLSID